MACLSRGEEGQNFLFYHVATTISMMMLSFFSEDERFFSEDERFFSEDERFFPSENHSHLVCLKAEGQELCIGRKYSHLGSFCVRFYT